MQPDNNQPQPPYQPQQPYPPQPGQPMYQPAPGVFDTMIPKNNGPSLVSYYCGIFGLLPFIGIPLAIVAIIFGVMGLNKYKANPAVRGRTHSLVGLILGILETVCFVGFIVLVVIGSSSNS